MRSPPDETDLSIFSNVFSYFRLAFSLFISAMAEALPVVLVGLGCPILDIKAAVSEEFLATYRSTTPSSSFFLFSFYFQLLNK
jgi:hypothetical protein